jgi:hypothetical protein
MDGRTLPDLEVRGAPKRLLSTGSDDLLLVVDVERVMGSSVVPGTSKPRVSTKP